MLLPLAEVAAIVHETDEFCSIATWSSLIS